MKKNKSASGIDAAFYSENDRGKSINQIILMKLNGTLKKKSFLLTFFAICMMGSPNNKKLVSA